MCQSIPAKNERRPLVIKSVKRRRREKRLVRSRQCTCGPLIISAVPCFIRIVSFHGGSGVQGLWTHIFLIDSPVITDHEAFDSCNTIFNRKCQQGEPSDHDSFDYIVELT